jgi:O-antigen/teichoic acid export membrane protein
MYYGISDMSSTLVSFGSALAVMGMYDAMYRMFFEKDDEEYKKEICSTTLSFTLGTSLVVFLLMLIFRQSLANYFFGNSKYSYVVYLSAMATLVGATNNIISAPTRMQNKRKIFLVTNTISPIISYTISIPMLLAGHYIIALPLAGVISGVTMEFSFWILNRKWFVLHKFRKEHLAPLLKIAIPLLPNFLIYWIFNSCDRVMITNLIGIEAAGIYSVASKLGSCSQLIYTAFAGGWQYFAFSTMKEENQVESNSRIFEYLGVISFLATAFVCACSYLIFKILFTEEYLSGYISAPYLFLAPLLQMLFQVAANQFIVVKKTWPNMFILGVGAIVNIIINYTLIPAIGIEGASLATLVGYVISDIICVIVLCKMELMVVSKRFMGVCAIMVGYLLLWRLFFTERVIVGTIFAIAMTFIYAVQYRKEAQTLVKALLGR